MDLFTVCTQCGCQIPASTATTPSSGTPKPIPECEVPEGNPAHCPETITMRGGAGAVTPLCLLLENPLHDTDPIRDLLKRLRRRRLANLVLEQAAVACSAVVAVVCLLLLVGTEVLNWYWPVSLLFLMLGIAAVRVVRRMPPPYLLLQEVDQRLGLHDELSTAHFFSRVQNARAGHSPMRAAQREEAEALARRIDPRTAVPFRMPGSVYVTVAAVFVAGSLFGLRYGVRRNLDLHPPIFTAMERFFRPTPEMVAAWNKPEPDAGETPSGDPSSPPSRDKRELSRDAASELTPAEASTDIVKPQPPDGRKDAWKELPGAETSDLPDAKTAPPSTGARMPPPAPKAREKDPPFPSQEDNALLKKMRDAFQKLLSRLDIKPPRGNGSRVRRGTQSANSLNKRRTPRQAGGSSEQQSATSRQARGRQARQGGDQARTGRTANQIRASGQAGQRQARSGMGSNEGSKKLRHVRQLEAMGKLAEILGKRAENVKGEVMVEVTKGDQRLRTAYSDTAATHGAAGGLIHRDRVPMELRPYVQRYFEEVRKQAPPSTDR